MAINNSGHDILASGVNHLAVRRSFQVPAQRGNLPFADQYIGVLESATRDCKYRGVPNESLLRPFPRRALRETSNWVDKANN
jgi:hypothetical protein